MSHRPRVEVHIEELVLHGFSPADRHLVAEALESELARQLRDGLPAALVDGGAAIERVDAGAVRVTNPARPASVGTEVAGAIARALGGGLDRQK
jgi:hypothetical protein